MEFKKLFFQILFLRHEIRKIYLLRNAVCFDIYNIFQLFSGQFDV